MRRDKPPASSTPAIFSCSLSFTVIAPRALARVPRGFLRDCTWVGVEDKTVLARERDESFALGAADQGQIRLARKLDAPGGETGARDQNRNPHLHRLDHHLACEPPGRVK